jgi:hypothetical protein
MLAVLRSTNEDTIFNGTHSRASFLEIGDTCDLGALYLWLIAEGNSPDFHR